VVVPEDPELSGPIRVPAEAVQAHEGDLVAVEVVDPLPHRQPHGRILRRLGRPGELDGELARLLLEHGLEKGFPEPVQQEAVQAAGRDTPAAGTRQRADLRGLPLVTIDPEDAKDFDDAVAVRPERDGFTLWVAIADVAAFVRPGGELDGEAQRRGCSVYLPGTVFPMLPPVLSERQCCLSPGEDRAAMVVQLRLGGRGQPMGGRIQRALIRSGARLEYGQVQRILDRQDPGGVPEELAEQLGDMAACARLLLSVLQARGALDLDLPESEIRLGPDGRPVQVAPRPRHFSCRIIEAFMIAANEAVGGTLRAAAAPALYRVHPPPDPEKFSAFTGLAHGLGVEARLPAAPAPRQVLAFLESLRGSPMRPLLNQLLLRSLMPAEYRAQCDPHFGLASPCYLHFTSPIRRYPDLFVHRQLGALLDRAGPEGLPLPLAGAGVVRRWPHTEAQAIQAAAASSAAERQALAVERAAQALYHCAYLQGRIGEEFDGQVGMVMEYGIYVRLQPSGIEGLVHVSRLRDDYYRYHEESLTLVGSRTRRVLKVGQAVRVRLTAVRLAERQIDFELIAVAHPKEE
jgi:ribonuclease R